MGRGFSEELAILVGKLLQAAKDGSTTGRIEMQDFGFGEDIAESLFLSHHLKRYTRLFMELNVSEATRTEHPTLPNARPWEPGDIIQAAEVAYRAFAGTVDVEIDSSYRSSLGCVKLLSGALEEGFFGPALPQASRLVTDGHGRPTAFILVTRFGPSAAHVVQIAVIPEAAGQGLGRALLANACVEASRMGIATLSLSVTEQNNRAVSLYRNMGFSEAHRFHAFRS